MRRAYVFIVFTLMAAGLSAAANALEIKRGKPIQGGLVLLSAAPGASLTTNGEPLMLNAEGLAIIGFHRDETDPVTITETDADGQTSSITLTPAKREYLEQRIDGLPKKMVTPPRKCWYGSAVIGRTSLPPAPMRRPFPPLCRPDHLAGRGHYHRGLRLPAGA